MLRLLLAGQDNSPRRDVVLLNAAAALATVNDNFSSALEEATLSLESGAALAKLDALVGLSQQMVQ
jgi:anthranilate phosphoribosyltransferase